MDEHEPRWTFTTGFFQKIHSRFKTPSFATLITGLVVGVPILFTDKTFVLDFTSIATLFAFVLVCGGVLLIPRKEKTPGKFSMPYVNGKFLFPLIVAGAIALALFLDKNYFADNTNFSFERKVEGLAAIIPAKSYDTTLVAKNVEQYLATNHGGDSSLIKLGTIVQSAPSDSKKIEEVSTVRTLFKL